MNFDKNIRLEWWAILLIIIAGVLIIISFFIPGILIKHFDSILLYNKSGQVGDSIGGLMSPFIGIAGVLLTFMAFYVQFKANRQQRELFSHELEDQRIQYRKSQFENQFYEMLRLHQENVAALELNQLKIIPNARNSEVFSENVKGRLVFDFILREIEVCYHIAMKFYPDDNFEKWINDAYSIVYIGLSNDKVNVNNYFKELNLIREKHKQYSYQNLGNILVDRLDLNLYYKLNYFLFNGHSNQLAHYFRHAYQTVKFIASQNEEFLSYEEKRSYLRIFRGQLSNQEQVLIFYNWFSTFGRKWENEENKFFTDYRMIHNIYPGLLLPGVNISELFDLNIGFRKESGRTNDPLFEYTDWYHS